MFSRASISNSVSYIRKECYSLLEYANANRGDGIFNDVTIIAGHSNIGANRMILSCYSKFFEKMFKSEMKERYEPSITIKQLDETALKYLVDYMYEGHISINNANVMDILAAGDLLQLAEVKEFCFEFLQMHLSSDNWYAALSAAKLYRCEQLEQHIYQFISDHLDKVIHSSDFKTMAIDDMTSLIATLRKSKKTIDETALCKLVLEWTKQDREEREAIFGDLFQLIGLKKMPFQALRNISAESLIKNSAVCLNAVMNELFDLFENNKATEKTRESTKIICLGGRTTGSKVVEVFNVFHETEQNYPDLPYEVEGHCLLKLNDVIFCIGGNSPNGWGNAYNKVCLMKLKQTNLKWEGAAPMNENRCRMGAAMFHDCLVVAGGWNKNCSMASTECCVDPFDKWRKAPSLKQKRNGNALVVCNDSLFALGGCDKITCLSSVERLRSLNGKWENVSPMLTARFELAAVHLNGYVYAIGGRSDISSSFTQNTVEKFDSYLNKWSYVCEMKHKRFGHSACIWHGKIFVIGGIDADGNAVKEIEIYDPKKDEWVVSKISDFLNYLFIFTGVVTV